MNKSQRGFTFVELIVVLVIIAILSTIGFTVYESYLGTGRDTARISLIRDIHSSFGTYSLKSRIPLPDNKVDITASGTVFAYQGDFTKEIANTIGFKGNPYDDNLNMYPSYMLLLNRKDSQILHYLEDRQSIQQAFIPQIYAFTDYQALFPKVMGKALGIMMDSDTQEPLHLISSVSSSGSYDVVTGTGELRAYYSQSEYYEDNIERIVPGKSCKRILELGGAKGSGEYTINPTGGSKIRVYCDMQTDGGGWTFISYIDTRNTLQDLFSSNVGTYRTDRNDGDSEDENTSYSIDARNLEHTEMMYALDNKDPVIANKDNKLLFYKYNSTNIGFYNGPLPCSSWVDKPQYRIGLSGLYNQSYGIVCNATEWRASALSNAVMIRIYSGRGLYWYPEMGGDSTGYHSGWVYVR